MRWYRAAFGDGQLMEAAANSLIIGGMATVVATAAGTLCAYGLWKRASRWMSTSLSLSLVTPEIVMGIALLAFFQWVFRYLGVRLAFELF